MLRGKNVDEFELSRTIAIAHKLPHLNTPESLSAMRDGMHVKTGVVFGIR